MREDRRGTTRIRRSRAALVAAVVALAALTVVPHPAGAVEPPEVAFVTVPVAGSIDPVPIVAEVVGATSVVAHVVLGFDAPFDVPLEDQGSDQWSTLLDPLPAGTLVRVRVTATGLGGDTDFPDGDLDELDEVHYVGAVVERPPIDTALPIVDWYIAPADHQALVTQLGSSTYRPAVLFVDGVVYDAVRVRLQGGDVTRAQPKKNYRFRMPGGVDLVFPEVSTRPLEEFVLDAESADPLGVRGELAWRAVDRAGGPTVAHGKVRLERGHQFEGLYTFLEEYDDEWLEAEGIEDALLYESEDAAYLHDVGPDELGDLWDQKEPEDAPHDALAEWARAVDAPPGAEASADLLAQTDLATLVNYYAVNAVLANIDTVNHNIWLVQAPDSERWSPLHWDLDLTLGLPTGTAPSTPIMPSIVHLAAALSQDPRLTDMVLRRIRTLADELLGADGAVADWLDELEGLVAPEIALDAAKWPKPTTYAEDEAQLRDFLVSRQATVDELWTDDAQLPPPATGDEPVVISEIRATGDPAGDFVELANPGSTSVDVSGWGLYDEVLIATLPAGTVIPPGERIVVPTGLQAPEGSPRDRLVVGTLGEELPDGGGPLALLDTDLVERTAVVWEAGPPWPSAPGGRSIELADLASDEALPGSWQASAAVGGTPGAAPSGPSGLTVDIWADGSLVTPSADLAVDIEVVNHGPAARTDVVVVGPQPACNRTYPSLPVGARRVHRCHVEAEDTFFGFTLLSATAQPAGGPIVASPRRLVSVVVVPELAVPPAPLREVLLDPGGGLSARWDPLPAFPARRYQISQLAPGTGAAVDRDIGAR